MKPLQSFFAAVAGILAVSCANRTVGSSADKDIVINDTLTRAELVTMDVLTQHNIVSDLTPEKKLELYDYKLQKDLASGTLNDEEAALMKDLRAHMNVHIYADKAAKDEFNAYAKTIEEKLRNDYGWDDRKMFQYTETIMTAEEAEPVLLAKEKMMK